MNTLKRRVVDYSPIVLLFLLAIIGFWNTEWSMLPLCFIFLLSISFVFVRRGWQNAVVSLNWLDAALLLVLIAEVVTYFLSTYRPNSFLYTIKLTVFLLLYYSFRICVRKDNYLWTLILLLTVYTFALGITTLFFFYDFYYDIAAVGFTSVTNFRNLYRPFGEFNNEWVTVLIGLLPFPASYLVIKSNHKYLKLFSAATLIIIICAILLSFSRGGYLAFFVFLAAISILGYFYRVLSVKSIVKYGGMLMVVLTILISPFYKPLSTTLSMSGTTSQVRSIEGREVLWGNAFGIFKDFPATGIGSGNFAMKYSSYATERDDTQFTGRVTNSILQLAVEKGIVGLIAYVSLLLIFLYQSHITIKRNKKKSNKVIQISVVAGLLAILARELTFSSLFESDALIVILSLYFVVSTPGTTAILLSMRWVNVAYFGLLIVLLFAVTFENFYHKRADHHYSIFLKKATDYNFGEARNQIRKASSLQADNAQYHAQQALLYAKTLGGSFNVIDITKRVQTRKERALISESVSSYLKALAINDDSGCHHNIGWLFFVKGETDKAFFHVRKAIEIDSGIGIYRISLGLMYESMGKVRQAFQEYAKGIRLSPEVTDSEFFRDVQARHPRIARAIKETAIDSLQLIDNHHNSPIIRARLGKLLLDIGEKDQAKKMLQQAATELPNLNRVWYYLGVISESILDTAYAKLCYQRSAALDSWDYLPQEKLGDLHHGKEDWLAVRHYNRALQNWLRVYSEQYTRSGRIYSNNSVHDNLLPNGLLTYCKPQFDYQRVCNRVAAIYQQQGEEQKATSYRSVSSKQQLKDVLEN